MQETSVDKEVSFDVLERILDMRDTSLAFFTHLLRLSPSVFYEPIHQVSSPIFQNKPLYRQSSSTQDKLSCPDKDDRGHNLSSTFHIFTLTERPFAWIRRPQELPEGLEARMQSSEPASHSHTLTHTHIISTCAWTPRKLRRDQTCANSSEV